MKEQIASTGERLPINVCGICGYKFDSATCLQGEHRPRPGDITLCFKCGEAYEFSDTMKLNPFSLSGLLGMDERQHALIDKAQREIRRNRFIK